MGAYDESLSQILDALEAWDFSPAYPADYPSANGVILQDGWPYQLMNQIEALANGEMSEYLISALVLSTPEQAIRLGNVMGPGAVGGTTRYGKRVNMSIVISAWADQRLGGLDAVRKLGGQVQGCLLYNQNRLQAIRHITVSNTSEGPEMGAQLYHFDVTIKGDGIVSVDA